MSWTGRNLLETSEEWAEDLTGKMGKVNNFLYLFFLAPNRDLVNMHIILTRQTITSHLHLEQERNIFSSGCKLPIGGK
jgi:hypothetical protein